MARLTSMIEVRLALELRRGHKTFTLDNNSTVQHFLKPSQTNIQVISLPDSTSAILH